MPVEQTTDARFPCPCCGFATLPAASPSWATCPVCEWIDEPVEDEAGRERLLVAQRSYREIGTSDPDAVERVRAPTDAERRGAIAIAIADGPSPRAHRRAALEAEIRAAFAEVSPDGRTTLRAAYRADTYHEANSDWDDRDRHWDEIPDDVLAYFGHVTSAFTFGNLASFRYYLPAYMLYTLRTGETKPTVYALDLRVPTGTNAADLPEVATLSIAQRRAVARFLRYKLDGWPDSAAERALTRVWGAWEHASLPTHIEPLRARSLDE